MGNKKVKKEFTVGLIEVYRGLPALWDVRCKDYSNYHATQFTFIQHVDFMKFWQGLFVQCGCVSLLAIVQYIAQPLISPPYGTIFCPNQNIVQQY